MDFQHHRWQAAKKYARCEILSTNGNSSLISIYSPFVLSFVEG